MEKKYEGFYMPERYVSNPGSEKMFSHRIEVYSVKNLFWHPRNAQYLVPGGLQQLILEADLGLLLPEIAELANAEESKSRKKYRPQESLKSSRIFRLPESWRRLKEYILPRFEVKENGIGYSFQIRRDAFKLENPLEFRIAVYLMKDKQILAEGREKVQLWVRRRNNGISASDISASDIELRYLPEATDLRLN